MTESSFCLLIGLVLLTGCPDRETRPGKDDTSAPADGGTAGEVWCEDELRQTKIELKQTKRERDGYKSDLDECVAKLPEGEPK